MRFTDLDVFQSMLGDTLLEVTTETILRKVLEANHVEHKNVIVNTILLDDDDMDSLLVHSGWVGEIHCAIYSTIIIKSRSVGMTTIGGKYPTYCRVTLVRGLNMSQLIEIYKKTMKMKAFL